MITEIIKINPFNPENEKIREAADLIKSKKLVAFPTETIYGLGANALDEEALKKIFIAKGRPQDNPLILHISDKSEIYKYAKEVPEKAKILIEKFWPGPLTLVLKKQNLVPDILTANLDSVAIRMPSNKVALELIKQAGPIAAPSANTSGKPSPTNASHVLEDLNGKIDMIIDGGETDIGLESTVLSLVDSPVLLRPGKITKEQIENIIGKIQVQEKSNSPQSPGMKYRHYSPKAKVILSENLDNLKQKYSNKKLMIIDEKNPEILAKTIFSKFREADRNNIDIILVRAIPEDNLGRAVMNRLRKAASEIIKI